MEYLGFIFAVIAGMVLHKLIRDHKEETKALEAEWASRAADNQIALLRSQWNLRKYHREERLKQKKPRTIHPL